MRINQKLMLKTKPVKTIYIPYLRIRYGSFIDGERLFNVIMITLVTVCCIVLALGFGYLFIKWVMFTGSKI